MAALPPGEIETFRIGPQKGVSGTFFGDKITDWPSAREKRWSRKLPTSGPDVAVIPSPHSLGDASHAPMAQAVHDGTLPVPDDLRAHLESGAFNWRMISTGDAVGALALKRRGINVVHFVHPEGRGVVSVDLRQHTPEELMAAVHSAKAMTEASHAREARDTALLGKSQREKETTRVASVAAERKGKLLFGRRKDNGKWTLPGGHLEPGEKPAKGAVRELMEETGLRPKSLALLGEETITTRGGDKIQVFAYLAEVDGEPTSENDPDDEMTEFRWVDSDCVPDDILENLHSKPNVTLQFLGLMGTEAVSTPAVAVVTKKSESFSRESANFQPSIKSGPVVSESGAMGFPVVVDVVDGQKRGVSDVATNTRAPPAVGGNDLHLFGPASRGGSHQAALTQGVPAHSGAARVQSAHSPLSPTGVLRSTLVSASLAKTGAIDSGSVPVVNTSPSRPPLSGESGARVEAPLASAAADNEFGRMSATVNHRPKITSEDSSVLSKAMKKPDKVGGNLIAVHNLSESNLAHAHELGGLAAPSLAIAHEKYPFHNFGEITLVAPKAMVDPKQTPVYDADVYSPRHPRAKMGINQKEASKFLKWIEPHVAPIRGNQFYPGGMIDELEERGVDSVLKHHSHRPMLAMAFHAERGEPVKPVMRRATLHYPWSAQPAMREFAKQHPPESSFDYGGAYHKAVSEAARKAIDQWSQSPEVSGPPGHPEKEEWARDAKERALKANFSEDGEDGLFHFGGSWKIIQDLEKAGTTEVDPDLTAKKAEFLLHANGGVLLPQFEAWAKQKLAPVLGDRYIPRHVDTANGPTVRKIPYTLENILKEVTRTVRGGENFNYGLGTARSFGAKKFRTLEQIRDAAAQGKIVSAEDFQKRKAAMDTRYGELVDAVRHYHADPNGFYVMDGLAQAIGDSYRKGKYLSRELEENGFNNVPYDVHTKIAEFARDLLAMPTEYFEAKPQRIVRLNEFHGAVVPHDVSPETLATLAAHGIDHIEKYTRDDPKARWEAVKKVARAKELHLAEMSLQKMAIRDLAPGKKLPEGPYLEAYDYTHLLPEEHRADYTMRVAKYNGEGPAFLPHLRAEIFHHGKQVGFASASLPPSMGKERALEVHHSKVKEKHRGKQLGMAAYEALMTHAFHVEGVHVVRGGKHSTLAAKTHAKLSARHDLDYMSRPNPDKSDDDLNDESTDGDYDEKFAPYQYTLKDEMRMTKADAAYDDVDRMLQHPDLLERKMALKLEGVTPWHISRALDDPDDGMRMDALLHPVTNAENLMRVAADPAKASMWPAVAKHPKHDGEHIRKMGELTVQDPSVFPMAAAAAMNSRVTPPETLAILLSHKGPQEQTIGLLGHPNINADHLAAVGHELAHSPDVDQNIDALKLVVAHPLTPTNTLNEIIDSHVGMPEHVQRMAFHHPNVDPKRKGDEATRLRLTKFESDVEEWLVSSGLKKAEDSNLMGGLQPNSEILRDMHGFQPQLEATFEAARFLIGGTAAPLENVRRALWEEDGDMYAAALRAYGISITDDNLRALRAVMVIQETQKADQAPPIAPTADVRAGMGDGDESARGVQRAIRAGQVMTVQLGGKHSKGSVVARDPDTKRNYLLKPGSGPQSPAAGAREDSSSQSQREAAFWHMARLWGIDRDFPRCDLILIDGKQYACMRLLDWNYKPMEKAQEKDSSEPRRDLEPYRHRGDLHRWALIDFVLGNPDRHAQNIMVNDRGDVKLIDHGSAFAGSAFNPSFDRDSFIPFYLRYATPSEVNFNQLTVPEKLHYMQSCPRDALEGLKRWVDTLHVEDLAQVLPAYGIDPGPEIERLSRVKSATGALDQTLNQLWAGT